MKRRHWLLAAGSLAMSLPRWLMATPRSCCDSCGCACAPQKVCRMVCETKKVPKTTYSYQHEDLCIPGPSERIRCADGSKADSENCGDEPYNKKRNWLWFPQCADVKTRTKLVKTVTEQDVVTPKWVVEYLCPDCCGTAAIPPAPPTP